MCLWSKGREVLGFMVSKRGIDANPNKVRGIMDLPEPKSVKYIPLFASLRGNKKFEWGKEQREAFSESRQ